MAQPRQHTTKRKITSGEGLNHRHVGHVYCSWECAEAAHGTCTPALLPLYEILQLVVIHKCHRCDTLLGPESELSKHKQSLNEPTPPPLPDDN